MSSQGTGLIHKRKSFRLYLGYSTFFHLSIACFLIISGKIVFQEMETKKKESLQLIATSIRVDMVAMPKFTLKELKSYNKAIVEEISSPQKKKVVKDTINKGDTVLLKKTKKKSFMEMMKDLSKKKIKKSKNLQKRKLKPSSKLPFSSKELRKLIAEGNKVSKGMALSGTGSAEALSAFASYMGNVVSKVRPNWKLPAYLLNKDFKCRIRVYLRPNGHLIKADIFESSGNVEYDERALKAVRDGSPFAQAGSHFSRRVSNGDIILGFPL